MSQLNNLECFAGEDVLITVSLAPATSIVGWTLTFTLKESYTAATALVSKTVGAGITITDSSNGVFTVSLSSANTNQTPRKYVYDIWRTNSGAATVLSHGFFTIKSEVRILS